MIMKSYTDLPQSKKLAEFLPIESADMYYCYGMNIHTKGWSFDDTPTIIDNSNQIDVHADIPCWSLAALISVLPKYLHTVLAIGELEKYAIGSTDTNKYDCIADNPVDACVAMIMRLYELKILSI
jgi:hypothetical protein